MNRTAYLLVLLAVATCIFAGNAGYPALLDDADSGHAIAAREMLESGDWAVMHINGVRWLEKAPLHYWLVAASYSIFGQNEFAVRLPSALAMMGLALLLFAFGREFFNERAGFYAGLILLTGVGTYIFTRSMIPEAIYALEFTAAFYFFLRAWTGSLTPRTGYWACAAVTGLAVLTRGLIGMIFPMAGIALFLLLTGGWRKWRELPIFSSAIVFLLIAAPWHIVVGLRTPGFWWFYFINEHFLRAIGARYPMDYGSVPLPLWWAEHLAWLFPWSFFLPFAWREIPAVRTWKPDMEKGAAARLLVFLWAGFILLFFSISRRMEYYSFGAWPAMALLLAVGLERAEESGSLWLPRLQRGLAVVGILVAATLGSLVWVSRDVSANGDISDLLSLQDEGSYRVAMSSFLDLTPKAFAALRLPAIGAAAAFLFGLGAAWWFRKAGRAMAANVAMAIGVVVFAFSANLAFAAFSPHISSKNLAQEIEKHLRPDDQVAIYGEFYAGATIGFYTHRKMWIYNGQYKGLEFGSYYPDAPKIFLDDKSFPALWNGPKRVFLFVSQFQRKEAYVRLPKESTWLLAESGGKAVYVNQPIIPGQLSLAQTPEKHVQSE